MRYLTLWLVLLVTGCATKHSVVNNSGFPLTVYQDGKKICAELPLGCVLPLDTYGLLWQNKTIVTVTGHDATGNYAGTATWIFISETAEAWEVSRLLVPKPPY